MSHVMQKLEKNSLSVKLIFNLKFVEQILFLNFFKKLRKNLYLFKF
jgi:hypothetical protein